MTNDPLTIEALERWALFGAGWRVVALSDERAVVDLYTCAGELVERRASGDAALVDYLRAAQSEPGQAPAPIPERDPLPFRVTEVERRTPTIVELRLRPLVKPLEYRPGEYVLLEDPDREVPPRSYSIANATRPDGVISLLVTRIAGGRTSGWVHERLETGAEVTVTGPYGTFVADPSSAAPCLYLAAGSGLAPIRALAEAELESGRPQPLVLVFSARTEAEVLDRDRFRHWQAVHPRFRFIRTLTRGPGPDPRGRVPAVLADLCPDLAGHEVFVAGAPGFVSACASAAEGLGAKRESVHTEPFFA